MPKAIWNGQVIAESDKTIMVEGNHYFPADVIDKRYFKPSDHTTICPWKGEAGYFDIEANGETNRNAAWRYADPKEKAAAIKGRVAFWKGVTVEP